jgi:hypothetical protein
VIKNHSNAEVTSVKIHNRNYADVLTRKDSALNIQDLTIKDCKFGLFSDLNSEMNASD